MDLNGIGRTLNFLFAILILSNSLEDRTKMEPNNIFIIRGLSMLVIFILVMFYSPGFSRVVQNSPGDKWGPIWNIFYAIGGMIIAYGALIEEYEGTEGYWGFFLRTILYSSSAGFLSFAIANFWGRIRYKVSQDDLQGNSWTFVDYETALLDKNKRLSDERFAIGNRLREAVISSIEDDRDIGKLASDGNIRRNAWLRAELDEFGKRNKSIIPARLLDWGKTNEEFSKNELRNYVEKNLLGIFESQLLVNVATGTRKFDQAWGNNAHTARKLIFQVGLHNVFSNRKGTREDYEPIMKRQMAMFLYIFSEIFGNKVANGDMGFNEGKMTIRSIISHLFTEKYTSIEDNRGYGGWAKYNEIEIGTSIRVDRSSNVAVCTDRLIGILPRLDLGIRRLDQGSVPWDEETGIEGSRSLLREWGESCWSFFEGSSATGE